MVIEAPHSDIITIEAANNQLGVEIGAPLSDIITIEVANILGKLFHSPRLFISDLSILHRK